jgi:hypothetical protein
MGTRALSSACHTRGNRKADSIVRRRTPHVKFETVIVDRQSGDVTRCGKDLTLIGTMSCSSSKARSVRPRGIAGLVSAALMACAVATVPTYAQAQTQTQAVLLQVRPSVGQEFVWRAVSKTEAVNAVGEFEMDVMLTQRVLARTEHDLTWSMKTATKATSKGVFAGIESALSAMDEQEMTKVVALTGQTTRLTMNGQEIPASGTPDVTFPEKAVAPGESWVATVVAGGRKANIRYTFKGRSTTGGAASLLIEGVYEPDQQFKSIEPTIFHLDPVDCTPIVASGVMEANFDGKILRTSFNVTRTSVKAAPKP